MLQQLTLRPVFLMRALEAFCDMAVTLETVASGHQMKSIFCALTRATPFDEPFPI
jgi:hypothetical protein